MSWLPRALVALTMLPVLSGCDHLFYFPGDKVRVTPDKLDLAFEPVWIDEADGTRLAAWHIKPSIQPHGVDRHAVIVHFHGNAENMTTHVLYVAWLAEAGFDVVTFDYRGYGASSGLPDREGLVRDGEAVLSWVARAPALAGKAVFVLGQSLGGAVAVPAAVLAPPPGLKGLIVDSDLRLLPPYRPGQTFGHLVDLVAAVAAVVSRQRRVEPGGHTSGRLSVPLLVVSGLDDPVVPLVYGQALFDAARPEARLMWEVPFPGHVSAFAEEDSPYRARLVAYLVAGGHEPRRESCRPKVFVLLMILSITAELFGHTGRSSEEQQ